MKIDNVIGWVGAGLLLLALVLNILGIRDLPYIIINLIGSLMISYSSYKKNDIQPAVLNIIWAIVSIVGVITLFVG